VDEPLLQERLGKLVESQTHENFTDFLEKQNFQWVVNGFVFTIQPKEVETKSNFIPSCKRGMYGI
jgi:hypothetical protein